MAFESLFTKCAHPSEVPLLDQKAKGICLLEASHEIPRAHLFNKSRIRLESTTIPVKAKTFTAATELIRIANAFGIAIIVRDVVCTVSRGISTLWHLKRQNNNKVTN